MCRQNVYKFCSWRQAPDASNLVLSFELSLQGRDYSGVVDRLREALALCYEHDIENYDLFVPAPKINPKDPMAQQLSSRVLKDSEAVMQPPRQLSSAVI